MKLTIVLLIIGCLQVSAKGYGQKISLVEKNSDLTEVLKNITKQSGYTFLYNDRSLRKAKKVSVDLQNGTLEQALEACFKDQPLSYSIEDKTIIIKEKKIAPPVETVNGESAVPAIVITGKVVDEKGQPVIGATVTVKGTRISTATNDNGVFSINVKDANAVLVFSSVGYQSIDVSLDGRSSVNITMTQSTNVIGDVVVTALGVKRERKAIGYAVSTVSGDELVKAGATMNPFLALYGKASGVGVNASASGPMGGIKINIRGAFSMNPNQNTRPLFVVDGVIISDRSTEMGGTVGAGYDYGANINDLNSEDIESIDILKGAKATVLYGTDAANGVVLITTKSGKNAKGFGMTGAFQYTIEKPKSYLDLQSEYGLGDNIYDTTYGTVNGQRVRQTSIDRWSFGPKFDGATEMFYDSSTVTNSPHKSYEGLFNTGHSYNANVAIAGNSDKGSLRASYTNYRYNDIISPNSYQQRNTFSFNGNIKASKLASFELVTNI